MASVGALTFSSRGGVRMLRQARGSASTNKSRGQSAGSSSSSSASSPFSSSCSTLQHTSLHSQVSTSSAQCPHQSVQVPGADVCLLSLRGHATHRASSSLMSKGSRRALVESAPALAAAASVGADANGSLGGVFTALIATLGLGAGMVSVVDEYSVGSGHKAREQRLKNHCSVRSPSSPPSNVATFQQGPVLSAVAAAAPVSSHHSSVDVVHPRALPVVHVPGPRAGDTNSSVAAEATPSTSFSLVHAETPATETHPAHSSKAGNTLSPIRRRNARMIRREALEFTEEALAAKPLLPYSEAPKTVKAAPKVNPSKKILSELSATATMTEGTEVSVRALRGRRLQMEDEYTICNNGKFVAVFDGHGGSGVARYLRQSLYARVLYYLGKVHDGDHSSMEDTSLPMATSANLSEEEKEAVSAKQGTLRFLNFLRRMRQANVSEDVKVEADLTKQMNALQSAFRSIELDVLMRDRFHYQGSTAVVCMVHEHNQSKGSSDVTDGASSPPSTKKTKSLIVANIGDSRAVLSRNGEAVSLTKDHKPNAVGERSRLTALGESIEFDGFVHRVRNLSLSRAIGDRHAKPAVSSEVDISRHTVDAQKDEFVILASDGLWDVMSNQDVVQFVHDKLGKSSQNQDLPPGLRVMDPAENDFEEDMKLLQKWKRKQMSRFLANEAMKRGTMDNVCVAVVWLNDDAIQGGNQEDAIAVPKGTRQ